jgi:hypothetical protein
VTPTAARFARMSDRRKIAPLRRTGRRLEARPEYEPLPESEMPL